MSALWRRRQRYGRNCVQVLVRIEKYGRVSLMVSYGSKLGSISRDMSRDSNREIRRGVIVKNNGIVSKNGSNKDFVGMGN